MTRRKILVWVAAAFILAAASVLYQPPTPGETQTVRPIDLTAKVESSQCQACHTTLGPSKVPGVRFSHGNHLIFDCEACHFQPPHEGGKTQRPPMKACFSCHGVGHAEGPLASGKCTDCHSPAFKLRPRDHTKDWAKKPHVAAANKDLNGCMLCHSAPKDCDACHRKERVNVGPMPPIYNTVIPTKPDLPPVIVFPDQPPTIGQCVYCHPDVDALPKATLKRLIFKHDPHLKRNYACVSCHPAFAHSAEKIAKPPMQTCYQCHGLVHASQGVVAGEACQKCHPRGFILKPPDHTKDFVNGTHGKPANTNGAYCAMCHKPKFCVECHLGRKPNASGKRQKVIPADHKKAQWRKAHGPLFMKQTGSCASCHDSKSCTTCHKTIMPHPTNWANTHFLRKGVTDYNAQQRSDCNVCHTDRNTCQQCHHDSVRRKELVASNCVGCHEEMKTVPATKIKNKGFAEHAVHFNVYKKNREHRPYICEDCHIGFGTGPARPTDLRQGHDLRLCYECHGALDYQNVQIAPYPGSQLCLKCHTDLNI